MAPGKLKIPGHFLPPLSAVITAALLLFSFAAALPRLILAAALLAGAAPGTLRAGKAGSLLEAVPADPPSAAGDYNQDGLVDLKDLAVFFIAMADCLAQPASDSTCSWIADANGDRKVDVLDTEECLYFIFKGPWYPSYGPVMVHPDSLPLLSAGAKELALTRLDRLIPLFPQWVGYPPGRSGPGANQIALLRDRIAAIPAAGRVSCNLNGDGEADLADAVTLVLLGRSADPRADWNGNGRFQINDMISFIIDLRDGNCR